MSCIQATTTCKPSLGPVVRRHPKSLDTVYCASLSSTFHKKSRNLRSAKLAYNSLKSKRLTPICGIGGAGGAASSDDPLMESLRKAMEEMKQEKPFQDVLKEKIPGLGFGGDGGAGKKPRGGGGGGDGAGEGSGFNFKEWLDEVLQVFLATLGLISVFVYIVRGEELVLLARDYIKFWLWGKKSGRLVRRNERLE